MTRATTLQGWWYQLLVKRANGNVALLASLIGITTRTLGRYADGTIELPTKPHRISLRRVAGEDLLNLKGCPKYLRHPSRQVVVEPPRSKKR